MNIETTVVHKGDRRKNPDTPGAFVPSSTPIYTATTYLYEDTAKLDRVLGREEPGFCYGRYDNPTRTGLEELLTELEAGHSSQVCSSGMMAIHVALLAALTDRRKSVLAANALYGATTTLLTQVLEPMGVSVDFVDICDLAAVQRKIAETKPGCIVL
jgi:O-acetylhomoserine/O-acetylserine sulfhydrylase-like pyridoxal-dependent enzyme